MNFLNIITPHEESKWRKSIERERRELNNYSIHSKKGHYPLGSLLNEAAGRDGQFVNLKCGIICRKSIHKPEPKTSYLLLPVSMLYQSPSSCTFFRYYYFLKLKILRVRFRESISSGHQTWSLASHNSIEDNTSHHLIASNDEANTMAIIS